LGDKVASGVELTEGELVVVLVVQDVEKIAQEGVKVLFISHEHEMAQCKLTSRMGNSETIRPIFSSKVSWVNLTFRM
jgi:hypothetical protein